MKQLRVIIAGDISFANIDHFSIGEKFASSFENADITVGNLEAVLTESEEKRKLHPYHLKASPTFISKLSSFSAFSLANNHVIDYGRTGLKDTMDLLKSTNQAFFGAGFSREQAETPWLVEQNGFKLAFFGVSRFANTNLFRSVGTASDRSRTIRKQIASLKRQGYFIIVMPHWSYEYVPYPSPLDRTVGKKLIESGADVVVGSHPHEMQGIESIKGKSVFYSLGNFIFSSKDFILNENWKLYQSFVVELTINTDHSYSYQLLPYLTSDTTVELLEEKAAQQVRDYVLSISGKFDLQDKEYKILFYESIRKMRANRLKKTGGIAKSTSLKSRIRSLTIRLIYMSIQDFKLAFYLYVTKFLVREKQA